MRSGVLVLAFLLAAGCLQANPPVAQQTLPAPRAGAWSLLGDAPLPAHVSNLPVGHDLYEPTIGVTPKGTLAICCVDVPQEFGGAALAALPGVVVSQDNGTTWPTRHTQPAPSFDPMLAVDPVTGRIHMLNMVGVSCTDLSFSDDEGATWTDRPASCAVPYYDFPKLVAGRPGPMANPLAGRLYPTVLYQCRNVNVPPLAPTMLANWCAVSYDGGLTWPVDRQVAARPRIDGAPGLPGDPCGGVTGFPTVAPDGTAVLPIGNGCASFLLGVSRDSGLTWEQRMGPGTWGIESPTPEAEFDAAGNLFVLWQDANATMRVARSRDAGATWDAVWDVTPPGAHALAFEAMVAGDEGRLAFAFFGSASGQQYIGLTGDEATWDLYIGTVEAGGTASPRIALYRANPEGDPVQVGPVCFGGGTCTRNLGDFITAAAGPDGTFRVAYGDGCTEQCVTGRSLDSEGALGAAGMVASLRGWSLRG
ncbi:MAG TPA: sialidase family protein [Candidatus Thermoplasmatota archaeon]|nr:sialidase family protein [Candidatus Thermoplasmatota archaeon]